MTQYRIVTYEMEDGSFTYEPQYRLLGLFWCSFEFHNRDSSFESARAYIHCDKAYTTKGIVAIKEVA